MRTKYTVLVFSENESTKDIVLMRDFESEGLDETTFKQALSSTVDDFLPPDKRVTSSRPVVIVAVDESVNARFLESAPTVPTNGCYAQPVEAQQEFPSAIAASRHLGLKNNEVALYLQKVRHVANPAERLAKIRGCTVQYRDDFNQGLLANVRD